MTFPFSFQNSLHDANLSTQHEFFVVSMGVKEIVYRRGQRHG